MYKKENKYCSSLYCNHLILTQKTFSEEYLLAVGLKRILEKYGNSVKIINLLRDNNKNIIFFDVCPYVIDSEIVDYVSPLLETAETIWVITTKKENLIEFFKKHYDTINERIETGQTKVVYLINEKQLVTSQFAKVKSFIYLFNDINTANIFSKKFFTPYVLATQTFWPFIFRLVVNNLFDRNTILIPIFGNLISKWRLEELEIIPHLDKNIENYRKSTEIKNLELVVLVSNKGYSDIKKILNSNNLKNTQIKIVDSIDTILKAFEQAIIVLLFNSINGYFQEEWLTIMHQNYVIYYSNPSRSSIFSQYPFSSYINTKQHFPFCYYPENPKAAIFDEINDTISKRKYEVIFSYKSQKYSFIDLLFGMEQVWEYTIAQQNLFSVQKTDSL